MEVHYTWRKRKFVLYFLWTLKQKSFHRVGSVNGTDSRFPVNGQNDPLTQALLDVLCDGPDEGASTRRASRCATLCAFCLRTA